MWWCISDMDVSVRCNCPAIKNKINTILRTVTRSTNLLQWYFLSQHSYLSQHHKWWLQTCTKCQQKESSLSSLWFVISPFQSNTWHRTCQFQSQLTITVYKHSYPYQNYTNTCTLKIYTTIYDNLFLTMQLISAKFTWQAYCNKKHCSSLLKIWFIWCGNLLYNLSPTFNALEKT